MTSQFALRAHQVFTVLGVPPWDTNAIDVTLDFAQGAHTARLLYCEPGSDIVCGGLAPVLARRRLSRSNRPDQRAPVFIAGHWDPDDRPARSSARSLSVVARA